jgi:hypothetical protein
MMLRRLFVIAMVLSNTMSVLRADSPAVTAPETQLIDTLTLDPFYTKHVSANGFPILSSAKVSDAALHEVAYLNNQMLNGREDIQLALNDSKTRFAIMAPSEFISRQSLAVHPTGTSHRLTPPLRLGS